MTKVRVVIVGGGIIGAMAALRLARDHAVTVVDPLDAATRTSDGSLAWLNVCTTGNESYARLRKAALENWHALAAEYPEMPVAFCGSLMWSGKPDAAPAQAELAARLGWRAEVLDAQGFLRHAPGFASPPANALFLPDEGRADPVEITQWALAQAGALGAQVVQGHVASVDVANGAVTGLTLTNGETMAAEAVVVAAGHGSAGLLDKLGIDLPVVRKPGFVLRSKPLPPVGAAVFGSPVLDFWQDAKGHVLMASSLAKTGGDALNLAASDALSALRTMYPDLRPEAETVIQRDRPIPADGVSIVGALSAIGGLYTAVTHSGMTLAPVLAEALAHEIATGAPLPVAAPFTPARPMDQPKETSPW